MGKNCFVCTTPYQLIAAVSIARSFHKDSDLVIVPQFVDANVYAERVEKTNVFKKVIYGQFGDIERYKNRKTSIGIKLGIIENYIRINNLVPEYLGDVNYDCVFISSQAIIGRLISLYYRKYGADVVYYDDGEGSYDDNILYEAQGVDRIIRMLMFGRDSIKLGTKRILYCPELYKLTFGDVDNVVRLPNWSKDINTLSILNYICGVTDEAKIYNKYIFLDTIPSESFDEKGQLQYIKLFNVCVKELSSELIIKRHPRDSRRYNVLCDIYKYSSIPFELICANSNINNKVLITTGSSAAFTPKILFDCEPFVISLHQITGYKYNIDNKREKMISYVRSLYRDKSRVIIPNSVENFIQVINCLKKI